MKHKIEKALQNYKKKRIVDKNLKPAAVLVPLFYHEGQYHVLFTKRSNEVNDHKGQVSFPGGAYEPADSRLIQTALREAEEEIGLRTEDVEILGELDDGITTSGYIISPFVSFIPYPYPFKTDRKEVEEILLVPLLVLMDEINFREDYYPTEYKSGPGYVYEYEGHIIWGATARILKQFINLLQTENGASR